MGWEFWRAQLAQAQVVPHDLLHVVTVGRYVAEELCRPRSV